LADEKNYFVFSNNKDIDKLIIFHKGIKGFRDFLKLDKAEKYDLIIDAHDDVSTTVSFLIQLSGAPNKLALKKENKEIFTATVPRPDASQTHVVDRILELAKPLHIQYDKSKLNIIYNLKEDSIKFSNDFLQSNNGDNKFLVGINISAGSDARFWGVERFIKLIEFFKTFNVEVLILTAEKDLSKANKIRSSTNVKVFMSKDFDIFAAMISKLDFLFTPDTSVIHLASAFQIPLFGLYVKYNTEDIIWYPYKSEYEEITTTEPTFTNLEFAEVKRKLEPFFKRILNEKAAH
jgi:ADP-heptose:LPS heptosyltransferase